jgi:hypothetical protein
MRVNGFVIVAALLTQAMVAHADEWPVPRIQNIFSSNGQYFVRVIPGMVVNAAAGTDKAHGEFYRRQPNRSYRLIADVELQNRVSPTYAIVTDDGYFVTFDDWFQIGIGHAIAFYQPTGVLIRAVTIEEMYTPERLSQIPRSVSSRWWRCGVFYTPPAGVNEEALTVTEHFGGGFVLHPRTGTFDYRAGTAVCRTGDAKIF